MNNITGGAGGGGLSGTVDSGRLSQVSGCHGGASNPAAMEKQVFAVQAEPGVKTHLEKT